MRPRLLLVHPSMGPPGGGEGLAAWALQALRDDYEITVLCWTAPQREALNRYFGTTLRAGDYRVLQASPALRRVLDLAPLPLAYLRTLILQRVCARLCRRESFDVLLCTHNEFAFPRPGIQYVHYPCHHPDRPEADLRWYHRLPGALAVYRQLSRRIGRDRPEAVRRNLTLVNSAFIGGLYRQWYGVAAQVLYPPVAGDYRASEAGPRDDDFVCVGRLAPCKRLDRVVEILRRVREAGHPVRLHVAGSWNCEGGERRALEALFARHREWVELHLDLDRRALVAEIARHHYGLHAMEEEHFGMAVAEMQRAGCLVFVPEHGGPREIVGGEPALTFDGVDEAVAKILCVLADPALRQRLTADLPARRARFTERRFVAELRAAVAGFLHGAGAGGPTPGRAVPPGGHGRADPHGGAQGAAAGARRGGGGTPRAGAAASRPEGAPPEPPPAPADAVESPGCRE